MQSPDRIRYNLRKRDVPRSEYTTRVKRRVSTDATRKNVSLTLFQQKSEKTQHHQTASEKIITASTVTTKSSSSNLRKVSNVQLTSATPIVNIEPLHQSNFATEVLEYRDNKGEENHNSQRKIRQQWQNDFPNSPEFSSMNDRRKSVLKTSPNYSSTPLLTTPVVKHVCFGVKKNTETSVETFSSSKQSTTETVHQDVFIGKNEKDNSLEKELFHDISFSRLSRIWCSNDEDYGKIKNYSRIDGSFISEDFSDDDIEVVSPTLTINHARRSRYRQIRREWYLNRWDSYKKSSVQNTFIYYIRWIFFLLVRWSKKCSRSLNRKVFVLTGAIKNFYNHHMPQERIIFLATSNIYKIMISIYTYVKNIFIAVSYKSYGFIFLRRSDYMLLADGKSYSINGFPSSQEKNGATQYLITEEDDDDLALCFCWKWLYLLLGIILLLPILFSATWLYAADKLLIIPDPTKFGIIQGQALLLDDLNIPVWHIRPPHIPNLGLNKSFELNLPVVLYLHGPGPGPGDVTGNHTLRVLNTLSSLGYHVIVPIPVLGLSQVLSVWSWIKAKTNAFSYIWGEHIQLRDMKVYAEKCCQDMRPPAGVVIQKEVEVKKVQHRQLEVWTCNCTTVTDEYGHFQRYINVRCPLYHQEDLYDEIVSCVEVFGKTK